ncbi:putative pimeloyl-ACP methyl ester carboxylesterase [Candidatus Planktophila versatilis]|uniref:Pimeloyl-ACP methyl ester carboxylesterase n=1 Tax=Candidatus Planktophila versatilis TaxID=1884905 RepID=A0AAC9YUK6_9ACTN|nr:alpha/beta hydrolase [Candidatus Planktophila versatilis]ASY22036.1 putative pimeloyl-ACP methyl ester carboxylesterase [Candidatus Planktophila versatilis]
MQTFSTNPGKALSTRTGKITAAITVFALALFSTVSYIQSRPEIPTNLAAYYAQQLQWQSCYENYQCADLLVPIDYTELRTGTFNISVLKYPTTGEKKTGSLIVNPGGPGGSGVDYAYAAEYLFSPTILNAYDIVGFDPRGVGRSEPIVCLSDNELDANYASDSKPDNEQEFAQILIESKKFIQQCEEKNKHLTSFSTANAARDMDILREAVGDKQLNYMGKSYGTFLGTLYAQFFPENVGHMVLDGAVDPTISNFRQGLTQAVAFDKAFAAFAADCNTRSKCPLPKEKSAAIDEMKKILSQVAKKPNKRLSESLVLLGVAAALYDSATGWPKLRIAIRDVMNGKGDKFLALADEYTGRTQDGNYTANEFDSGAIIDCLDFTDARSVKQMKEDAMVFAEQAPLFGPYLAYGGLVCQYFDTPQATEVVPTKTANPIVIIGTTGDPATPYEWAQGLHRILTNSVLISLSGEGHTGQGQDNKCVDGQVDDFYLESKTPSRTTCS